MKKSHFTIIELLLVISIAGVMLSVAVPAFSRMIKGSASGIAVWELMGKINAARSYAISNGTYVALVFPGTSETSDFQKRFGYRSYRVCEVAPDGTGYRFLRWIPGENWQYFPNGILFGYGTGAEYPVKAKNDDEKTADGTTNIHSASALSCNIGGRSYSESGTTKNIANYLVFRPDGMTDQFPDPILLRLRDGKVDSSGEATDVSSGYYPLVVRFNGKPKAYNELVE